MRERKKDRGGGGGGWGGLGWRCGGDGLQRFSRGKGLEGGRLALWWGLTNAGVSLEHIGNK